MSLKERLINWLRYKRYKKKIAHLPEGKRPQPLLDVGCGSFPITGADFVVDYSHCEFDPYYSSEFRAKLNARFVQCDIHHLPFRDKTFGFVHCSNVLEHVDDPRQAFKELKRVGNHGFVECPSELRERVIHHPIEHAWIINWKDGKIVNKKPTQLHVWGIQILPFPFSDWIRNNCRLFWKCFDYFIDQVLNISYNKFRF